MARKEFMDYPHLLKKKKKYIPYKEFIKIMERKYATIDVLCGEISKLKKLLQKNIEIFRRHNVFLKEKNLFDEFQEWKKTQREQSFTLDFVEMYWGKVLRELAKEKNGGK